MLSINKIYSWLFVFALLIQIPSVHLFKFADELLAVIMMCLVGLDVIVNQKIEKYKMLWIVAIIMALYAIYSMIFLSYNTPIAIVHDYITQMKPFCYFYVSYAIVPYFNNSVKTILRKICLLNALVALFCVVTGSVKYVFFHVTYLGLVSMLTSMVYLIASVDEKGKISRKNMIIAILILSIGLFCTRSKFYGEYVMALYLLFIYVPGFSKNIKPAHVCAFILSIVLVLIVSWQKIEFYFISAGTDGLMSEELLMQMARPMLYGGMVALLIMHPLLGSGLASFATNASSSAVNYAETYSVIGLDAVWGLSPDYDAFICDAYYPSLAQFGLVGIVLFILFFVWIYKKLGLILYEQGKLLYSVGIMSIVVIIIEGIAATTFNQPAGALCMMILGYLVSQFKNISKKELLEIRERGYKDEKALDYIK